jgi:hypothetical protein
LNNLCFMVKKINKMNIFLSKDDQQYGPYTLDVVKDYISDGTFNRGDFACCDGRNWIPLSEVPGVIATPSTPERTAPKAKEKSRKGLLIGLIGGGSALVVASIVLVVLLKDDPKENEIDQRGNLADQGKPSDPDEVTEVAPIDANKDVSLVENLVGELEQAKKDLAVIRAKAGLPVDDAKPDFERLLEIEKEKMSSAMRRSELLLAKARKDADNGQYDLAINQIDEALAILPANRLSIALISDLYKAKQQVTWYKMGEAMLNGHVAEVQALVVEYQEMEYARRKAESEALGIDEEMDFDAEMEKARQKSEEQAELAEEMLSRARGDIKKKEYDKANEALFKIKNFLEPNTRTWPVILEASLVKNEINLEKAKDAMAETNLDLAAQYIDAYRTGFFQDRDIQGDVTARGRPGLKATKGQGAVDRALDLANKLEGKLKAMGYSVSTPNDSVRSSDSKMERKLKIIQMPGLQFFESPLDEVMQELQRQARQFDLTEPDPAKKGVNIVMIPEKGMPYPNVTATFNAMPLGQVIKFATQTVNWTYDAQADDAVIISRQRASR